MAQRNLFGLSLDERFERWARENPGIVEHFLRYARELKGSGVRHYGIKSIAERVRWHVRVESRDQDFKINNNYVSRLARLLVKRDPSLEGLFETRRLHS